MQPGGRLYPRRAWAVSRGDLALATLKYCFSSRSAGKTVTAVTAGDPCDGARKSVPLLAAEAPERRPQGRRRRLTSRQLAAELLRLDHHAFRDEGAHELY